MIESRTPGGHPLWSDGGGGAEARFAGRGAGDDRQQLARAAGAGARQVAWNRQVHSPRVRGAVAGCGGEADALVTVDPGLVLSVVTADCVPVLLGGAGEAAAIHAGWRGIAAGVIDATLGRMTGTGELTAWIGPAIGPCCYEVGHEVAAQVARVSSERVVVAGPGARPHLDLAAAVEIQLTRGGVDDVRRVAVCTRCAPARLWSYRRDGPRAGRNLAFVWLRGPDRTG